MGCSAWSIRPNASLPDCRWSPAPARMVPASSRWRRRPAKSGLTICTPRPAEFSRMFQAADSDGMEATVLAIAAQFGTASLVHLLTPLALPTLTGASHSHIGLWLSVAAWRSGRHRRRFAAAGRRPGPGRRAQGADEKLFGHGDRGRQAARGRRQSEIEREILAKLANPPKGRQNWAEHSQPGRGRRGDRQCRPAVRRFHPTRFEPVRRSTPRFGPCCGSAPTACCKTTSARPSSAGPIA